MRKLDRVLELAAEVNEARAAVARLEGELEQLLGGEPAGGGAVLAERREITAERAASSARGPAPIGRTKVVELVKAGNGASEIATALNCSLKSVYGHVYEAKKRGELPKEDGRKP